MPYKSEAQRRLMQGIAHGWKPTRKKGKKLPTKAQAKKYVKHSEKKGLLE